MHVNESPNTPIVDLSFELIDVPVIPINVALDRASHKYFA